MSAPPSKLSAFYALAGWIATKVRRLHRFPQGMGALCHSLWTAAASFCPHNGLQHGSCPLKRTMGTTIQLDLGQRFPPLSDGQGRPFPVLVEHPVQGRFVLHHLTASGRGFALVAAEPRKAVAL